jgi:ribose 5-phosphate isomerase A
VDGADEIDRKNRMIKGGGGAHVREKILASSSQTMIVIVDETKLVSSIGSRNLPVEILPYGAAQTRKKLEFMGFQGRWRIRRDETLFSTENGNLLFDLECTDAMRYPEEVEKKIRNCIGVVDTGLFLHLASLVIVGKLDGTTDVIVFR